jgi:hypothetical protein
MILCKAVLGYLLICKAVIFSHGMGLSHNYVETLVFISIPPLIRTVVFTSGGMMSVCEAYCLYSISMVKVMYSCSFMPHV